MFRRPRCSCGSKLITLFRSQSPARVCKNRANKNMTCSFTTTTWCIAVCCMGIKTKAKHPSKQLPVQIQAHAKNIVQQMISMQLLHAHDTKQPTQTPFCSALVTFFASCSPSKTEKLVDLTPYPMYFNAICRFVMWRWGWGIMLLPSKLD